MAEGDRAGFHIVDLVILSQEVVAEEPAVDLELGVFDVLVSLDGQQAAWSGVAVVEVKEIHFRSEVEVEVFSHVDAKNRVLVHVSLTLTLAEDVSGHR